MTAASASVCRGCTMCRPDHPVPTAAPSYVMCALCRTRPAIIPVRAGEERRVCAECAMDMPTELVGHPTTEER